MKILHSGDLHIDENKPNNQKCIDYMVEKSIEVKPDFTILAGDIFDSAGTKSTRGFGELLYLKEKLNLLENNKLKTIILYGTPNHDNRVAFKELFLTYKNSEYINIITESKILTIGDTDFVCITGDYNQFDIDSSLSYTEQNEMKTTKLNNLIDDMYKCCKNNNKILVSHFTCNDGSNDIFEDVMIDIRETSKLFDLITLGHIHKPQQITENAFYCGSIDATSFNDIGDKKGFWVHNLDNDKILKSDFIETPYKNHIVINLTNDDIKLLNNNDFSVLDSYNLTNSKIRFDFEDELDNVVDVEKYILDNGGESLSIKKSIKKEEKNVAIDKDENPLIILERYLNNKYTEEDVDIYKITELAKPIIEEFYQSNQTKMETGQFTPISISLKNYRSHKNTFVDFSKFNSVLLNGSNGSGKSSIVESISTCLYENTREGIIQAWISKDETSGSIEFIFSINMQCYKIIRSRSKKRASLKLYKFNIEKDEYVDISKDKIADTQSLIIDLIGMDCQAFKSCCFIAQDEYDVFLKATSDERIAMLTSLLGLSMYEDMEKRVKEQITLLNKDIKICKLDIETINNELDEIGSPQNELSVIEDDIVKHNNDIALYNSKIESLNKAKSEYDGLNYKIGLRLETQTEVKKEIDDLGKKVNELNYISEEVLKLPSLISEREILLNKYSKYEDILNNLNNLNVEKNTIIENIKVEDNKLKQIISDIKKGDEHLKNKIEFENILSKNAIDDKNRKNIKDDIQELNCLIDSIKIKLQNFEKDKIEICNKQAEVEKELIFIQSEIKHLSDFSSQYDNINCIDISSASCSFVKNSINALEKLNEQKELETIKLNESKKISSEFDNILSKISTTETEFNNNCEKLKELQQLEDDIFIKENKLKDALNQLEKISIYEENCRLLNEQKNTLVDSVKNNKLRLEEIDMSLDSIDSHSSEISNTKNELATIENNIKELEKLQLKLNDRDNILDKLSNKNSSMVDLLEEINILKTDLTKLKNNFSNVDFNEIVELIENTKLNINSKQQILNNALIKKGQMQEKVIKYNDLTNKLTNIKNHYKTIIGDISCYKILQNSFNYNGIPHSIIKTVIPFINNNANSIISTMTNGKMEILFKEEKILKNKKEVSALEIELKQKKTTLPYNSLSGGEKVRVSLAIALSLVEMKINKTGVKLGMLIIDEPSFLDDSGISTYCDSLDIIKNKYPNVKLIAVTHLDLMKSRFSNVINVSKNIDGESIIK